MNDTLQAGGLGLSEAQTSQKREGQKSDKTASKHVSHLRAFHPDFLESAGGRTDPTNHKEMGILYRPLMSFSTINTLCTENKRGAFAQPPLPLCFYISIDNM
ncbi:MAG TPA: hypothetical protein VMH28_23695 [Candidatus Acidoferrales bacterium]|nr:hypothetical protein [Candidatus Acidoferrales bacterium]